jgi:hypothetical protein
MNKVEAIKIQGQLMNAAANGGEKALWNIARGKGATAIVAREVIEVMTSPFQEVSLDAAVILACKILEEGENG